MALSTFSLSAQRGHLQLQFSDGQGQELWGQQIMPMVAFASDLLAEVARRKSGALQRLFVDLRCGTLQATVNGRSGIELVEIEGAEFEASVRPASTSVIYWAETLARC